MHFAVQGRDRMFAPVNTTARQLKLGRRCSLMGGKDVIALQQDRVNSGAAGIALPGFYRLAVASDHGLPLGPAVALPI